MREFIRKHYYWIIVTVVLTEQFLVGGISNNYSGLFMIPVTESLQISRGSFALAASVRSFCAAISSMCAGFLIKRFGYRKNVGFFLLVSSMSMFVLSGSSGVLMLGLGAALNGAADGACMTTGASRIVSNWFHRYQGTIFGLVTAATGLGGSAMCLLLTNIMEHSGWRAAYRCCMILLIIMSIVMWLVIRDRPEQLGLKPYGAGKTDGKKSSKKADKLWEGHDLKHLLHKPAFYMMLVGTFLSCACIYSASQTVVPHLQDCGLSLEYATTLQSMMLLALAGIKLVLGFVCDWIGAKKVTIICLAATVISLVLLSAVSGPVTALIGVLVLALALSMTALIIPLLTAELFGYRAQTSFVGIFVSMSSLAGMAAGPIVNTVYDRLGTYNPVFRIAAVVVAVLIGLYLLMYWLADRDKKEFLAMQQ